MRGSEEMVDFQHLSETLRKELDLFCNIKKPGKQSREKKHAARRSEQTVRRIARALEEIKETCLVSGCFTTQKNGLEACRKIAEVITRAPRHALGISVQSAAYDRKFRIEDSIMEIAKRLSEEQRKAVWRSGWGGQIQCLNYSFGPFGRKLDGVIEFMGQVEDEEEDDGSEGDEGDLDLEN